MVSYWHCDKYEIKYRTNLLLPEVLLSVLIFLYPQQYSLLWCFIIPDLKHTMEKQSACWFKDPTQPCQERSKCQTEPADQDDHPLTAIMPRLKQVARSRKWFVTLSVCDVAAPTECRERAARGTCLQETTFPNTLLWRKQNNQPGFKPLFLRALRSFKVNQLITQLALKKKKIKNSPTNSVPLGLGEDGWPQKCVFLAHCLSRAPRMVPA